MNNEREILFVVGSLGSGGVERVATLLGNHLAEDGYKITIAMLLDNTIHYALHPAIEVVDLSKGPRCKPFRLHQWLRGLRRVNKQKHFHAAISFFLKGGMVLAAAYKHNGVRLIARESEDPRHSRRGFVERHLMNHYLRHMDAIVFQSRYQMQCFPKIIQNKGQIIPNPVSCPNKALIPYSQRAKRIVTVGRLITDKRLDVIIKGFALFHHNHPDYRLDIYGDGPRKDDLESLISQTGLQKDIALLGLSKSIAQDIMDAKAFVLASKFEGQSNALIEAMIGGLPSISSRWNGSDEIIRDGQNGLLFDGASDVQLALALERLIYNEKLAESIIVEATALSDKYSLLHVVSAWKKIII